MKQSSPFKLLSSVFNIALYLAAGFAAPMFFKNFPDKRQAAVLAGGFFILTALRAVRLSLARPYPLNFKKFFFAVFLVDLIFWVWRVADGRLLGDITLLGIPGAYFHHVMSVIYVVSAIAFVYSEIRWLAKSF